MIKKISIVGVSVLLFILILFGSATFNTEQNEYGIVREFGKIVRVIDKAGLNFKIPFIQSVSKVSKSDIMYDISASDVITRDKKTMVSDSLAIWRISDPLKFVQTLSGQRANAEARLNTTIYNSMKNIISNLTQAEMITSRDGMLGTMIMENIGSTFDQYGIELKAVEIKRLDLPSSNKDAVYERMISERNNIAAQYTAEGESEAKKIKNQTDADIAIRISKAKSEAETLVAEGEAEYMKILSSAYSDKKRAEFYEFVRSLDALSISMKGDNKTIILDSNSPIAKIFNNID